MNFAIHLFINFTLNKFLSSHSQNVILLDYFKKLIYFLQLFSFIIDLVCAGDTSTQRGRGCSEISTASGARARPAPMSRTENT